MERQATEQQGHGQSACTLLVKHLPEAIPFATLVRLFSHYDASSVRPCVAGRLKNCAFVDFKDESAVSRAELQLNRLRFLGKVLVVERAKPLSGVQSSESNKKESGKSSCPFTGYVSEKDINTTKPSIQSSVFVGESVAPKLGIEYPFPPHLEYAYPPPDGNILTNIVNALIAVPRFYTQVLHLMNKMNLPAPFCPALPTPPLPPQATAPSQAPEPQDLSTDESELESSSEDEMEKRKSTSGAASKPDFGNVKSSVTRKRPRVEMTATVKSASLLPKELPTVKKRPPVLQIKINSKATPIEDIQNTEDDTENELDKSTQVDDNVVKHCATVEELEANKIPLSEILLLPMFKNYTPGNPAPILYIKNLAKDVIVDDLYYVFGSLFKDGSTTKAAVGVKLMQEGRMRGQAFVTFSSVELAEHALKMAHGFMLKGKPMIIQFGRNPSASKAS